jgi:site-specific DNA-methyltransferase (adenine-specific)
MANYFDKNKTYLGDCLELMPKIENESIDMILCDLPYGTTSQKWDIVIPFNELWEQYERIIKPNGAIVLFGKNPFTAKLILSNEKLFKYELIWEKTRAGNNMQVCKQPSAIHENILVFYKKQPTYNDLKFKVDEKYIDKRKSINDSFYSNGHYKGVMKRKADDGLRHPQSVLPFNSVWKKGMHPTEKPTELFEWLVKSYTNESELVLDNTAGSGTTAEACFNTNRNYIQFEKDEDYFNLILEREKSFIKKDDKQLTLFNTGT